jgi:flagellar basal body-associated protein FliL
MRKIMGAEALEKKKKRNVLVMSIVILGVLVISTIGYAFLSGDKEENPGEGTGNNEGGPFTFESNGETFTLNNAPQNVSWISVNIDKTLKDYSQKAIYIVSDDEQISREIAVNIGRFAERVQNACLGRCAKNLVERSCSENLIVYNSSATASRVYQDGECVFIEGGMASADAFIYKIFGIN